MIGIITAMDCEALAVLEYMSNVHTSNQIARKIHVGTILNEEVVVAVCGIGKVNAAICTQYIIDCYAPDYIVNIGLSGCFKNELTIGDLAYIPSCVQYDFDLTQIDNTELGKLNEFDNKYLNAKTCAHTEKITKILPCCLLATADKFSNNPSDINIVKNIMHADMRDMEGGAIFQTTIMNNVPLICIKCVSNSISETASNEYSKNKALALDIMKKNLKPIWEIICNG